MDVPFISEWNMDSYAYLIPNLNDFRHASLNRGDTMQKWLGDNFLFFLIDGHVRFDVIDYHDTPRVFHLKENDVVFFTPCLTYTMTVLSDTAEFLYLHLHLFTPLNMNPPTDPTKLTLEFSEPISHENINIFLPRTLHVETHGTSYFLFQKILYEVDHLSPGYSISLRGLVLSLIVNLFREAGLEFKSVLTHMNMVCVASLGNRDIPMSEGSELCISDLQIWSANPQITQSNANLLATFSSQNFYVDRPRNDDVLTCQAFPADNNSELPYMRITAKEPTIYQIWYDSSEKNITDLYQYRKNARLTVNVRSNKAGSYG